MILLKSEKEIEQIRIAGKIGGLVIKALGDFIKPGITTKDLENLAGKVISENNARPAFRGYKGFPADICTSVNEEVIHGIPNDRVLNEGDIVSVDVGVSYFDSESEYFSDSATTFAVGEISAETKKLLEVTEKALYLAIDECKIGNRLGNLSWKIQSFVENNGFSVVRDFVGHGIGKNIHEEPQIPNFGEMGYGPRLKKGMVFCIEPMVNMGKSNVIVKNDGWTVITEDKTRSAHFEHTIAITESGTEILTK